MVILSHYFWDSEIVTTKIGRRIPGSLFCSDLNWSCWCFWLTCNIFSAYLHELGLLSSNISNDFILLKFSTIIQTGGDAWALQTSYNYRYVIWVAIIDCLFTKNDVTIFICSTMLYCSILKYPKFNVLNKKTIWNGYQ